MSRRIRDHLRGNVIGYLALFVALSGTAVALPGTNTVFTDDIVNGHVRTLDISNINGVQSPDVRDDTLTNGGLQAVDLRPDSVGATEVAANSIDGDEVADNGLGGADINEATLSGLGANDGFFSLCDPGSTTFTDCAGTTITLGRTMNVLIIAMSHFNTFSDAPAWGNCRLERNEVAVSNDHPIGELDPTEDTSRTVHQGGMNLLDVQVLAAGTYTFEISCNQENADVEYPDQRIAVVKLAQD